jgi:RND family efflux transporter MFP subunit
MQLDPQDLLLAQTQAKAALTAAESNRDLAQADLKRYQELRTKNFVAAAVLDSKEVAYKAAQASFEQATAGFKNQSNQAGYATLIADVDGVVTGIDAEVGQVVAAGTPVVRVAQSGEMDVLVGIPENKINTIRQMSDIRVGLWADPTLALPGKLRELSPVADAVTYLSGESQFARGCKRCTSRYDGQCQLRRTEFIAGILNCRPQLYFRIRA